MDNIQQVEPTRSGSTTVEPRETSFHQHQDRQPMLVRAMKLPTYLRSYEEKGLLGKLFRYEAVAKSSYKDRFKELLRTLGTLSAPRYNWWTGEVLDVKQWADPMVLGPNGSAQCSEVWLREVNGREFSIQVVGDYPVRPGHVISGLQVKKRWRGDNLVLVVNHSTRQYWDLGLPKAHRTLHLLLVFIGVLMVVGLSTGITLDLTTHLTSATKNYLVGYAATTLLGPPVFFVSYLYWHRLLRDQGVLPMNSASLAMLDYLNSLSEQDVRAMRS